MFGAKEKNQDKELEGEKRCYFRQLRHIRYFAISTKADTVPRTLKESKALLFL